MASRPWILCGWAALAAAAVVLARSPRAADACTYLGCGSAGPPNVCSGCTTQNACYCISNSCVPKKLCKTAPRTYSSNATEDLFRCSQICYTTFRCTLTDGTSSGPCSLTSDCNSWPGEIEGGSEIFYVSSPPCTGTPVPPV